MSHSQCRTWSDTKTLKWSSWKVTDENHTALKFVTLGDNGLFFDDVIMAHRLGLHCVVLVYGGESTVTKEVGHKEGLRKEGE